MPRAALPVVHTSTRTALKRCPWRWWMTYEEGYRPKFAQADALWLGIGVHEALAQWYLPGKRRGTHPAKYFAQWAGDEIAYVKSWLDEQYEEAVWLDARDLGVAMLEGYIDRYGRDPQWQVIAVERPFSVRITDKKRPVAIFRSRWDMVFRNLQDRKIYLGEHKTANQIVTEYLENDDQGGSYWAVAGSVLRAEGVLKDGEEIAGIIYNFLRKSMPDERPENAEGLKLNKDETVSKKQPAVRYLRHPVMRSRPEQHTQLQHIADEVALMNAYRSGALNLTKTPTKDCVRCPLRIPCVLHERGLPSFADEMKAHFVKGDPYGEEGTDYKSAAA
jgi:PD-(D/E)XK nuclease superfamily